MTYQQQHLFVYGTLMSAFNKTNPMHNQTLGQHARLIGDAMVRGAQLYNVGRYPAAVKSDDPSDVIYGELYGFSSDIAGNLLTQLDEFEECEGCIDAGAVPLYQREIAHVKLTADDDRDSGTLIPAWIYWWSTKRKLEGLTRISSGRYSIGQL